MTEFTSLARAKLCSIHVAFAVLIFFVTAHIAQADERTIKSFEQWRGQHLVEVAAYQEFLQDRGVANVVPMHELARTASAWKSCGKPLGSKPFEIPPQQSWKNIIPTLNLVAVLREQKLLGKTQAVSVYRDSAMNECAGGGKRSRHMDNSALDIAPDPNRAKAQIQGLCQFWRREGAKYQMGLGLYASGRVHIDTGLYRSWGPNGEGTTSPCRKAAHHS